MLVVSKERCWEGARTSGCLNVLGFEAGIRARYMTGNHSQEATDRVLGPPREFAPMPSTVSLYFPTPCPALQMS